MMEDEQLDNPNLAIRRHHDRCFHVVEEVVPGGYIVEGIFIDEDEVAQVRSADGLSGSCEVDREG